jgi:hypothetical protein
MLASVPRVARFVLVVALAVGAAPGTARAADGWTQVRDPHSGTLTAVSAASSTDIWAVGYFYDQATARYIPLAEHSDGGSFVSYRPQTIGRGYNAFNGVATISPTDAWAVGYRTPLYYTYEHFAFIEHWDGAAWRIVSQPFAGQATLYAVVAATSDDVWAVGQRSDNPYGSLVEHWDGSGWTIVDDGHASDGSGLFSAVTSGDGDLWFGGVTAANGPQAFLERLHAGTFTGFVAADEDLTQFNAVASVGNGRLWGVGWQSPGFGVYQYAELYDGTGFVDEPLPQLPSNNALYGATAVGETVWAVGYGSKTGVRPLIERWTGTSWVAERNPATIGTLYGITTDGSSLWAVGDNVILTRGI